MVISLLLYFSKIYSQPVYKGHPEEPEYVLFKSSCPLSYRLKFYALFINGGNDAVLYTQRFVI